MLIITLSFREELVTVRTQMLVLLALSSVLLCHILQKLNVIVYKAFNMKLVNISYHVAAM